MTHTSLWPVTALTLIIAPPSTLAGPSLSNLYQEVERLEANLDDPKALLDAAEIRSYLLHHAHALLHLENYARVTGRPPPSKRAEPIERAASIHTTRVKITLPGDVIETTGDAALELRSPGRPPLVLPIAATVVDLRLDRTVWTVELRHPHLQLHESLLDVDEEPLTHALAPSAREAPTPVAGLLDRALAAYRVGRDDEVVALLAGPSSAHPDHELTQWLLGAAASNLGQWLTAVTAFERLEARGAQTRLYADRLADARARLESEQLAVIIRSHPSGVYVEQATAAGWQPLGETPLTARFSPGRQNVRLSRAGYARLNHDLDIKPGMPPVELTLVPLDPAIGDSRADWIGGSLVASGVALLAVGIWQAVDLDDQRAWWDRPDWHISELSMREEQFVTTRSYMIAALAGGAVLSGLGAWFLFGED